MLKRLKKISAIFSPRYFKSPDAKEDRGRVGEAMAVKFLKEKGYRIIQRNFTCSLGEIDIIASEGECLVFVEVKTRTSTLFGEPEEAVNKNKQQHLRRVAYVYLRRHRLHLRETPFRFDIVSIIVDSESHEIKSIRLLKSVF